MSTNTFQVTRPTHLVAPSTPGAFPVEPGTGRAQRALKDTTSAAF
jgi:hypothetical protein